MCSSDLVFWETCLTSCRKSLNGQAVIPSTTDLFRTSGRFARLENTACAGHAGCCFPRGNRVVSPSMPSAISSSINRVACSVPRQWLYLFGEEGGVVYSESQGRFAGLDAAGVAAFLASDINESRMPGNEIEPIRDLARGIFPGEDASEDWPPFDANACSKGSGAEVEAQVEIGEIPVLVRYPAGPVARLYGDYFRGCERTSASPRCCLSAEQTERGWAIQVNGRQFLSIEKEDQLGLGLMHAARSALYQLASYDVAFHAAMVAQGDCGLLLCAPRESGKSTLAAYLAAREFEFLADEPALLQLDSRSVQSLPLPISLKEGSWSSLQKEWPQLAVAPMHVRSDGMSIRLLHLPEERISLWPRQLTHLLFPKYSPSAALEPERVSPLKTLCLLSEGGMLFQRHSMRENFETFLHLLSETPASTLPFSSLAGAAQALSRVLSG